MRNARFRCTGIARYDALSGGASGAMRWRVFITGLVLATTGGAGFCHADCAALYTLAQRHAHDMARRDSLDHAGFKRLRGPAGAVAENVAVGCETEACARRMWMRSPPHRANMMLGGCQAVASAVSASGRRYRAMEIGGNSRANIRQPGVTLARGARRGRVHDGIVGRDFSTDGSNAP